MRTSAPHTTVYTVSDETPLASHTTRPHGSAVVELRGIKKSYAQILAASKSNTTPANTAAWYNSDTTITSLQRLTAEQRVQKSFPKAKLASCPDQNAAFLAVATGRADGIVVENCLLAQFNKSNGDKLKEVLFARPLHVEYGSYGVQKGNTKLAAGLSAFICKMHKSGQLAKLYKSTIGAPLPLMPRCR